MPTESETKQARYSQIEKEPDAFGRVIGVGRLKPSERAKLAGMTSDLSGYDEITSEDGTKIQVPHRLPLLLAASVRLIGDNPVPFPRDRAMLDAIYDRLDEEGLAAASKAMARLSETDEAPTTPDDAKN
jgi:hypothetical protein